VNSCIDDYYLPKEKAWLPEIEQAITSLRQAIAEAEAEKHEPVACEKCGKAIKDGKVKCVQGRNCWVGQQPAQRTEQEPQSVRERWNIERDGDDLLVCFNDHDKSQACTYTRYVPSSQRTEQEPVAYKPPAKWTDAEIEDGYRGIRWVAADGVYGRPSEEDVARYLGYTTPSTAQRPWVGLTDEEMNEAMDYWSDRSRSAYGGAHAADGEYVSMISTWRYIEAKIKQKNGYAEENT